MIDTPDELAEAIRGGSFDSYYVADLIVDGQIVLQDQALTACELVADGSQKILTQGTATFTYTDELGTSILPKDLTSWLTPAASFLDISYRVAVGDTYSAKVLKGRFKIIGVSDPLGRVIKFQDRLLTVGSQVTLKLADLFYMTAYDRFIAPTAPSDLSSVYAEIGRLTGLALDRSGVDDMAITRTVTYDDAALDAVFDLAAIVSGNPYVTPAGAVRLAPMAWGDPVVDLSMGANGTVARADADDLSLDGVYNQVVVRSWDDTQATVLAHAEVPSGPLRYGNPQGMGKKPTFLSSQFVTTNAQAQQWADDQLPLVSKLPAVTYTVQCAPDPRLEVWDVVSLSTQDATDLPARIQKITLPAKGQMTMTVQVDRG